MATIVSKIVSLVKGRTIDIIGITVPAFCDVFSNHFEAFVTRRTITMKWNCYVIKTTLHLLFVIYFLNNRKFCVSIDPILNLNAFQSKEKLIYAKSPLQKILLKRLEGKRVITIRKKTGNCKPNNARCIQIYMNIENK